MMRGLRVLRSVVIALVLLIAVYKLSTKSLDLSQYSELAQGAKDRITGTTGGLSGAKEPAAEPPAAPAVPAVPAAQTPAAAASPAGDTSPAPAAQPPLTPGANYERESATFVSLARNEDLWGLVSSIREVEDRFNHQFHYDWVFLNDAEFTEEFKEVTSSFVSGKTHYGHIPPEHWSYPSWIDQEKAALAREQMQQDQVIYGGSVSYRHMCRFESGFFWRNPALDNFKYYWRVEPHIKLFCDIDFDVFKFMAENKKKYAFTISLYEYVKTIPTLWATVKEFMAKFPQYLAPNNLLDFISDDNGETYNNCHFWSNFEVGDLDFWRSDGYRTFFDHLDQAGGFFYERWGDAPVHSIAAALMLNKDEVHFFDNIGYWHVPFQNCPVGKEERTRLHCTCPKDESLEPNQRDIFTYRGYSCTPRYFKVTGKERPKGWYEYADT